MATKAPPLLRRVVSLDAALSQHLHSLSHSVLPRSALLLLEFSADFRVFLPASLAILAAAAPSSPLRHPFGTALILGLFLDLILVGLVKSIFRRARPLYNKNMSVAVAADNFSFPSGHASRVCFVAAYVYLSAATLHDGFSPGRLSGFFDRWMDSDKSKIIRSFVSFVWVWAVATSVSRVFLGRHFVSDVFAGACLGVLEGLFVFHVFRF